MKPVYFYPRPPRGGRRTDGKIVIFDQKISIHALREEGDLPTAATQPLVIVISIHALREEGDLPRRWPSTPPCRFLSTPSARRATCFHGHAPFSKSISIHALREEGDFGTRYYANQYEQFLSTPSARRATCPYSGQKVSLDNFYPRPPRGGRRSWSGRGTAQRDFYPRPPRGGRPARRRRVYVVQIISIHALREEGDSGGAYTTHRLRNFYPRPPRGGRQTKNQPFCPKKLFLSTPSARRATPLRGMPSRPG